MSSRASTSGFEYCALFEPRPPFAAIALRVQAIGNVRVGANQIRAADIAESNCDCSQKSPHITAAGKFDIFISTPDLGKRLLQELLHLLAR